MLFKNVINIKNPDLGIDIEYHPGVWSELESEEIFNRLIQETTWDQKEGKLYGKPYLQPRLTAWYGDKNAVYKYAGTKNNPLPWSDLLLELKNRINTIKNTNFNSVLLNYYRNGEDSVSWHADDEKELGDDIASVSFGVERVFKLKHMLFKYPKEKRFEKFPDLKSVSPKKLKHDINLESGSLLLMSGETQKNWLHAILKSKKVLTPRINLTFRVVNIQK